MEPTAIRPEEARMIERCLKRDRKAQRELYERFAPKMLALCQRYTGSRDEAQDVMQDGFVTVFSQLDRFRGQGSFEGWIRRIFVTTALMYLRRHDVLDNSEDITVTHFSPDTGSDTLGQLGYKELMRLVSTLPPGARVVFNMFAIEGYSHKEISEMTGISEISSRSQLNRARQWLQKKITEEYR